ncbi:hypothetical protein [Saccharospirillum mangrovi]|uniref:hypothetical protein n=1 Tax=Saccharospirillum mangrovi TaxID=2161747 RepID=UPI000D363249|nr:hypothetical protein [Saccharospirillum mangrovi]
MNPRRLTFDSTGAPSVRPVSLRAWRWVLFAIAVLIVNGVAQHWHAPVHLAEQMQTPVALSVSDIETDDADEHSCLICHLLKLGQTGAILALIAPMQNLIVPVADAIAVIAVDQRLSQPAARGPPAFLSTQD